MMKSLKVIARDDGLPVPRLCAAQSEAVVGGSSILRGQVYLLVANFGEFCKGS